MDKAAAKRKKISRLYTLTEVAREVGISMATVQRYKSLYQSRIPSVGESRKQRYPKEALAVFATLKQENAGRRGRPRKASDEAPARAAKRASSGENLLTLTEVGKRTGISYPTLIRYAQSHGREIPHQGRGRKRRFHPEAVEVFQRLRGESRPDRKPKAGAAPSAAPVAAAPLSDRRVERLEMTVAKLEKQLKELLARLRKPRRMI